MTRRRMIRSFSCFVVFHPQHSSLSWWCAASPFSRYSLASVELRRSFTSVMYRLLHARQPRLVRAAFRLIFRLYRDGNELLSALRGVYLLNHEGSAHK